MKRKDLKAASSTELELLNSAWPRLPKHVRNTISGLVQLYGARKSGVRFETPAGASWADVSIELIRAGTVRIAVKGVSRVYTFAELKLTDKRSPKKPNAVWRMLRTYAENPEPDAYYRLPYRRNLKVDISRFRTWLQGFFGIAGDPLKPFKTGLWRPRFKILEKYED
jgi:hypothetical protein